MSQVCIFFIGAAVGCCIGIVITAIAAAARRADDWEEWAQSQAQREEQDK